MAEKNKTMINDNGSEAPYAGACSDLNAKDFLTFGPPNRSEEIPALRLFLGKYQMYPSITECQPDDDAFYFHVTSILNYLRDEFHHDLDKDCVLRKYNQKVKKHIDNSRLVDLGNGIMIKLSESYLDNDVQNPNKLKPDHLDNYFLTAEEIIIYHLPILKAIVEDLASQFKEMTVFSSKSCTIQMVCHNSCGYYLSSIKIKKPLITDLALHYGRKFVPIHDKILKSLNTKDSKGIVLLHGIPGSGKTHYIRYLAQEIEDKTLIYVPPDMAKEISSPQFLPFLMQYQDAVLIIEDAENIIKDRSETTTPSQAVANLLNLSDGLLGDAMHQQIIATFNCDLTVIDPALLRKGRLIANYEFNKLDLESSKILSDKLGYSSENITEAMTLAEIYNQGDNEQNEVEK